MPRKAAATLPLNPIFIGDLPTAEKEALQVFERLPDNIYQNSSLGKWGGVGHDEGTSCDCHYVPGRSEPYEACGEGSNCINRLTNVECIQGDCPSRRHCQNRRFQRKQYANVAIVQTEKKGFGLRAESDIAEDDFIYEYVGEVVKENEFLKRMGRYAQEGIRHFYFMMLQKETYIDATKKGDIGRFANHSCNPNCYVSKWYVGDKVRMGIFAKRKIFKYEELTFNYNVDRYGHDAQECFCGEPNCVGFIGGKTQTDIGGMDDLYIEALGITEDVEKYSLKGTKRKKSKVLDEDYIPPLTEINENGVPIFTKALRQSSSSNAKMLPHLLSRLELTKDPDVFRSFMRLRGFSLMHALLESHGEEKNVVRLILTSLRTWPLLNRNKVEDSNIEGTVTRIASSEDEDLKPLAEELLAWWGGLETAYRIPKRQVQPEDEEDILPVVSYVDRAPKRSRQDEEVEAPAFQYKALPPPPLEISSFVARPAAHAQSQYTAAPTWETHVELDDIIRQATQAAAEAEAKRIKEEQEAEAARLAKVERKAKEKERLVARKEKERERAKRKDNGRAATSAGASTSRSLKSLSTTSSLPPPSSKTSIDKAAEKDKRLLKLVGEVVVKHMSRYRDQLDRDLFKKTARDLTHLIAEKEKKSSSYRDGTLKTLSDEKRSKMKKFAHDYIKKVVDRKGKNRGGHQEAGSSRATTNDGDESTLLDSADADLLGDDIEAAIASPYKDGSDPIDEDQEGGRSPTPPTPARDEEHGYRPPSRQDDLNDDNMSVDGQSDVTIETPPRPPT